MKKRLRKKCCVGEFSVICFVFRADYETADEDALWERFAAKMQELDLYCMGEWNNGQVDLLCETGYIGNGEDERQASLAAWLKEQPEYQNVYISPLFDGRRGFSE